MNSGNRHTSSRWPRLLLWMLGTLLALGGVFALGALALPKQTSVQRSIYIDAPAEHVYHNVSDFHYWMFWSPWLEWDPEIFTWPDGKIKRGEGARWCWKSQDDWLENGCIEIQSAHPYRRIHTVAQKDTQVVYRGDWRIQAQQQGVEVTWSVDVYLDQKPVTGRYMGLMADKYIGRELEKGLRKLKRRVEKKGTQFW